MQIQTGLNPEHLTQYLNLKDHPLLAEWLPQQEAGLVRLLKGIPTSNEVNAYALEVVQAIAVLRFIEKVKALPDLADKQQKVMRQMEARA